MPSLLTSLLGYVAIALGVASTWVQVVRIRRDGVDGVSLATWVLFCETSVFWVWYGLAAAHSVIVVLGSALCFPLQAYVVAQLSPGRSPGVLTRASVFMALLVGLPSVGLGWSSGVYGMGVAMTLMRWPQLRALWHVRHADGVSAAAWTVGALCSALWMAYYLGDHQWAAFIATTAAGAASGWIAVLAAIRHRQSRRDHRLVGSFSA